MAKEVSEKILSRRPLAYLFLFLIIFSYFLWLNASPSFPDPDSFYHAKITELIMESGPVKDFYWLPFTTLDDIYIDHHFLYHLLLIPFVLFFHPLVGIKIAAVFFAALAIVIFQWLLDKFQIKYSFIYILLLLLAHQFIFRINLAKVPSLSLIFLLFFIYLLLLNKDKLPWKLFTIGFLYLWLYGGWPIMLGIGLIYFIASLIINYQDKSRAIKSFLSLSTGLLAGLVINPYFPTNLKFYWQQTVQIGLVNFKNIVDVGAEWYGMSIFDVIQYDLPILILFILALLIFFIYFKKQGLKTWTLFITSVIFFILTLKSQRNIEYFIPFSLLFSALAVNNFLAFKKINIIYLKKIYFKHQKIALVLTILSILYSPIVIGANFKGLKQNLRKNYNFNKFEPASFWLKKNTQADDIVFHDDWDDWPVFFYHNSYNRYIVGLDPSFMYFKNEDQYWRWKNISTGQTKKNICHTVAEKFSSNYIFVKTENKQLKENLDNDHACQLVYEDKDGRVYKISNL